MGQRNEPSLQRREFLLALAACGLASAAEPPFAAAAPAAKLTRAIPVSGERLPVIGMGTWITFDVGRDAQRREQRARVLGTFFELGGELVDSSPMYGSSEAVIGDCLSRMPNEPVLFAATKVWTWGQSRGIEQMQASRDRWGLERFDLMQIHNLLAWESHLETLLAHKAAGDVRYIGITTSHGRRHADMQAVMAAKPIAKPIDFVQFTYNILDRRAEQRLLPLAGERGLAVIVNRPFRGGDLFDYFADHPLPAWAAEIDCTSWAQFFLKFVVSHPDVTCAIPATSRVDHMRENMGALYGRLPDQRMREQMIRYVEKL